MRFRWTRRHAILAILAIVGLIIGLWCNGAWAYESAGQRSLSEAYKHVVQSIKRGMTRAEVLEILGREGRLEFSDRHEGTDATLPGRPPLSLLEFVWVFPSEWYNGCVGFFFAYDSSGALEEFNVYDP